MPLSQEQIVEIRKALEHVRNEAIFEMADVTDAALKRILWILENGEDAH